MLWTVPLCSHIFVTTQNNITMPKLLSDTTYWHAGPMSPRFVSSLKLRTRRVIFENKADGVREIPSIYELSEEDIDFLWYSKNEYRLIQKSCSFIVKMMERKIMIPADDGELCTRGLEFKIKAAARSRRQQVELSIDTVLLEQQRQWDAQYDNPKHIAAVCRQVTSECAMVAYLSGQKDAKIVEQLYQEQGRAGHISSKASSVKWRGLAFQKASEDKAARGACSTDSDSSTLPSTRRL